MNQIEALKIYNRKTASKEELREALAFFLGLEYEKPQKDVSTFEQCRQFFLQQYEKCTGVAYYWQAKDGFALKMLLKQLESLGNNKLFPVFQHLILKLPEWYKQNAYNVSTIYSKFNDIVRIIRNNNGNKSISNDYKLNILRDLLS